MARAWSKGDLAEAERIARFVRQTGAGRADTVTAYALARLCHDSGRLAEAEALYASARQGVPRGTAWDAEARWAASHCLLAQGVYSPESWSLFEARWDRPESPGKPRLPLLNAPEWVGGGLTGKRLLILPEEGLGDQIQFARFAPWLQERTGAEVTLVCNHALERLFQGLGVRVRSTDELPFDSFTQRTADAWAMTMSIPSLAGVNLENLPASPYLPASDGGGEPVRGRIGVAARGNPQHGNDAHRSLSGRDAEVLLSLPGAVDLDPGRTGARDMADTARIIASLDLVVTVDTAVAHLAGAMGKPVWVLLPDYRTDWRWGRGSTTSPWYPSARLYRQSAPGEWGCVLEAVRRDLEALA